METLERILVEHPFLSGLDDRYVQLLLGCAKNVRYEPGEIVGREGAEAVHFYMIREGRVAVEVPNQGTEPIPIDTVAAGDVLGWSWLIPPHHWRFDARAITPVRAFQLDGTCLRTKCEQDHDLGYELLSRFSRIVAQRLHATRLQLLDVWHAYRDIMEGRT